MKIGVAIETENEEADEVVREALRKCGGHPTFTFVTGVFVKYIWPCVMFESPSHTKEELLILGFEWVLRHRLGLPFEAEEITEDGFQYNEDADDRRVQDLVKCCEGGVAITRDEAMACINAIEYADCEGGASNFANRVAARLREGIGVRPNEYLTPPEN